MLVDKQNKDTRLMEALHSPCKRLTFELMQTRLFTLISPGRCHHVCYLFSRGCEIIFDFSSSV